MITTSKDNDKSHVNNFALLHCVGAIFVIIGHMYVLMGFTPPNFIGVEVHTLGVELLFVVSGYLVTNSLMQKQQKITLFYKKRLCRLLPALVLCLLFTVVICFFITSEKNTIYWRGAWSYIWHNSLFYPVFYLPGVFENAIVPNSVNGSLWTLPIEMFCYVILPIIIYINKRRPYFIRISYVPLSIIAIYVETTGNRLHFIVWGTDWIIAIRLITFFIAGVTAAELVATTEKQHYKCEHALVMLFLIGIWTTRLPGIRYYLLPYIVISIALAPPMKSKFFNKHEYTYGLYLYAFPIQQIVVLLVKKYNWINSIWLALPVSFMLTLMLAIVSHICIEKRVDRIMKKIEGRT